MKKKQTRAERYAAMARARAPVIAAIVKLEKRFGESAVAGAFTRHVQIRREKRKLERAQDEINAKIAKLEQ